MSTILFENDEISVHIRKYKFDFDGKGNKDNQISIREVNIRLMKALKPDDVQNTFKILSNFWDKCGNCKRYFFITLDFSQHIPLDINFIMEGVNFFKCVKKTTKTHCLFTCIKSNSTMVKWLVQTFTGVYTPVRPIFTFKEEEKGEPENCLLCNYKEFIRDLQKKQEEDD
tara:strand:- start:1689 stop:2198 length:510 start_codon:yes stop_codon:yes gene_type:complete